MAQHSNLHTIRFANSIRFVVINLRLDFQAVVSCLLKIYERYNNSNAKDQEKANDAMRLLNEIKSKKCCPHLSAVADIYDLFGVFC